MKKILFILIFIIISISLFSQTTDTGTLTIIGTVPPINRIIITPTNNSLDLSINTSIEIATITTISNSKTGYNLSLSSTNSGFFVDNTGTVIDTLAYTLEFDGTSYDLSTGEKILMSTSGKTGPAGTAESLFINYSGDSQLMYEGEYQDTLTFIISAK